MPSTATTIAIYAELGRHFRSNHIHFAEPTPITDAAVLGDLQAILEPETGRIDNLTQVTLNGETFTGLAQQRISLGRFQTLRFTLSPDEMSYRLIDAEEVAAFAQTDEGWSAVTEFAAIAKSGRASKKLNCKPGNVQCGGKCQSGKKNCRVNPSPDQQTAVKAAAKKAKGGGEPKQASNSTAERSPDSPQQRSASEATGKPMMNQAELDKRRRQLVKTYGEEEIARLEQRTKAFLDEAEVFVRVRSVDTLEKIIGDRFKTQFETATTGSGLLDTKRRAASEQQLFGAPKTLDPAQRPIYGYLARPQSPDSAEAGSVAVYGGIAIRLRSEVKARTTFTADDSLKRAGIGSEVRAYQPSSIANPNAASILERQEARSRTDVAGALSEAKDLGEFAAARRSNYVEAQVHGQVRNSDIAEIVFTGGTAPSPAVTRWAEENGVEIKILED